MRLAFTILLAIILVLVWGASWYLGIDLFLSVERSGGTIWQQILGAAFFINGTIALAGVALLGRKRT